jgi:hypothetical protein
VDSYHKLNSLFLFLVSRRKQTVVKSATKEEEYVVNISGYEKYDYEHTLCLLALVKRVTRMILSIKMNAVKKEIIISLALLVFFENYRRVRRECWLSPRGGAHISSRQDNSICHTLISGCGR